MPFVKHLLEYDQVMNEQREIIYGERKRVLYGENLRDSIIGMIGAVVERTVDAHRMSDDQLPEEWDMAAFSESLSAIIPVGKVNIKDEALPQMTKDKLKETLTKLGNQLYEMKEKEIGQGQAEGEERMRELERVVMLRVIDRNGWIAVMIWIRCVRGLGCMLPMQKTTLTEYKFTAYIMFEEMSNHIQEDTLKILYRVRIQTEVKQEEPQQQMF